MLGDKYTMSQKNFEKLKQDELEHRGHTELLPYLVRDIESIVNAFGEDHKKSLENELVDLIIQNR